MQKVGFGLLLLYSFTVLKYAMPFVDYALNLQTIQNELCINKDKPITYCGGSCYLEDELSKTVFDDSDSESGVVSSVLFDFLFFEEVNGYSFDLSESLLNASHCLSEAILEGFLNLIPQPPNTL